VARGPYRSPGAEVVALLVEFPTADHARCGYDVERPTETHALQGLAAPAEGDIRAVRVLGEERLLFNVLKGRHMVRIFATRNTAEAAHGLAQQFGRDLPDEAPSPLLAALPRADRLKGSARVVAHSPLPLMPGPVATAQYYCGSRIVVTGVARLPTPEEATRLRENHHRQAVDDFMSVNATRLGSMPAVSVVSTDTHEENLLIQDGQTLIALMNIPRRSDCLMLLEAVVTTRTEQAAVLDAGAPDSAHDKGPLDAGLTLKDAPTPPDVPTATPDASSKGSTQAAGDGGSIEFGVEAL
jgi:hypothetical protein